jgi:hypothetical protein
MSSHCYEKATSGWTLFDSGVAHARARARSPLRGSRFPFCALVLTGVGGRVDNARVRVRVCAQCRAMHPLHTRHAIFTIPVKLASCDSENCSAIKRNLT